jgi:hypothetical protein
MLDISSTSAGYIQSDYFLFFTQRLKIHYHEKSLPDKPFKELPYRPDSLCSGQFRGQKGLGPREISLEIGKLSGFPAKKNNIPHFLNRPYINS